MSRRWDVLRLAGLATRTTSASATAGVSIGEYLDGALIVRIVGLSGTNPRLVGYWQGSYDNLSFGDVKQMATAVATGMNILPLALLMGTPYGRARWTIGGTSAAIKFEVLVTAKE